ncbi:hypothetical protein [Streptomyces sp. NPDC002758]
MLALAFLAALAAATPEIRRLIGTLFVPPTRTLTTLLHWSTWRRHHRAAARRSHYQRRLTTETIT